MSAASVRAQHSDWLSALDGDGPWLTVPALTQGLEAGLTPSTPDMNQILRRAWAAYTTATPARAAQAQNTWISAIIEDLLGWGDHADFTHADRWAHTDPVHGITTTPGFALLPEAAEQAAEDVTPVILGFTYPAGTPLTKRVGDGWATTRIDRAAHALRAADVPLGLITDGRWWALLWAPRPNGGSAATPGYGLWSADLLLDDELLRSAFTTLMSRHRSLAVAGPKGLRGLFEKSAESQEDITENLSVQTRKAVELLVDAFSTANNRAGGAYLDGVDADHVYQGAVTIVMRLIFTLAAEERRLLPGDDDFYSKTYGIAALADRIIDRGNLDGEDLLADTYTAFAQILATTRVIHDGIHHNRLNIPGYGGSVFDPHRFPWLEAAPDTDLGPIGVDDRTMLHILRGLTRWDGRRLSYRTLDVEQIGYAYEGLLDHTAVLATSPVLGLIGKKEPEIALDDLEAAAARGKDHLVKVVKDLTGDTPSQIAKRLDSADGSSAEGGTRQHLISACGGDSDLADRVARWLPLLRVDSRTALPIVINEGTIYVTASSARGDTGTHYTPKWLAEDVVKTTLDGLIYSPGPLDTNEENAWRLVHPDKIIDLKIADIAMGSGAFLVAAIRYLADRLLEALELTTRDSLATPVLEEIWDLTHREVVKAEWDDTRDDEVSFAARALVAARCIYGVDINPMAVEMAKLSIWLGTASRNRPFGFLDHRLKAGDSLLGMHEIRQVACLHVDAERGEELYGRAPGRLHDFTAGMREALVRVAELLQQIEKKRVVDVHDVDQQQSLLDDADRLIGDLVLVADAVVSSALAAGNATGRPLDARVGAVQRQVEVLFGSASAEEAQTAARELLRGPLSEALAAHGRPCHFPLSFPDVFVLGRSGFDAIVGNPPFMGGGQISGRFGTDYRDYLSNVVAQGKKAKRPDLAAFFVLRMDALARAWGAVLTSTVSQGDSREVGLDQVLSRGRAIFHADSARRWPSKTAAVSYVTIAVTDHEVVHRSVLDAVVVPAISATLSSGAPNERPPIRLFENRLLAFQGSVLHGNGFMVSEEAALAMIQADSRNRLVLRPFVGGEDLIQRVDMRGPRFVIDFGDRSKEEISTFTLPLEWAEANVKPERERLDPKNYARIIREWWTYWAPRRELYSRIEPSSTVVAMALNSSTLTPALTPGDQVFGHTVMVIPQDSERFLAMLSSSVHLIWVLHYKSTWGTVVRYSITDLFETMPFPSGSATLSLAGKRIHEQRAAAMTQRGIGLSTLVGLINDIEVEEDDVVAIRLAAQQLDREVLKAYGWDDLFRPLTFVTTEFGPRWMLPQEVHDQVRARLLALNHNRHEEEVRANLVDPSGRSIKATGARRQKAPARGRSNDDGQASFFEVNPS